jgi:outer membrane lipoprotein LolB
MTNSFGTYCLIIAVSLLLWGCQALQPEYEQPATQLLSAGNQTKLQQFDRWQLQGKIGVTDGNKRDSAAINRWQQDRAVFEIQISSTLLGLGATTISGTGETLTIAEPGEPLITSNNPRLLLETSLGWEVPLDALRYWVKGSPLPEAPYRWEITPLSGSLMLEQSGWQITFDRIEENHFSHNDVTLLLPHRIVMSQQNKEIKVIVSRWDAF